MYGSVESAEKVRVDSILHVIAVDGLRKKCQISFVNKQRRQ